MGNIGLKEQAQAHLKLAHPHEGLGICPIVDRHALPFPAAGYENLYAEVVENGVARPGSHGLAPKTGLSRLNGRLPPRDVRLHARESTLRRRMET